MRFPLLSKAGAMAAVILVLLVALFRVEGLVNERQLRRKRSVIDTLAPLKTAC